MGLRGVSIAGCTLMGAIWLHLTGPFAVLRITTPLSENAPFWYMISVFPILGMLVGDFLESLKRSARPASIELAIQIIAIVAISNARLGLRLPISGHLLVVCFFITRRLQYGQTKGFHALEFVYAVLTLSALSYAKLVWWTDPITLGCGAILGVGMAVFGKHLLRKDRAEALDALAGNLRTMVKTCWRVLIVGGWAPLLVFAAHMLSDRVFDAYGRWPSFDIPMHFSGGLAIAFFISRCFQTLPRGTVSRSRCVVLELLLAGSLAATAAVFWEFAEFTLDQLFGSNIQVSLANTMKDMAMGISGAVVFILARARQLRMGTRELREVTNDWVRGKAA